MFLLQQIKIMPPAYKRPKDGKLALTVLFHSGFFWFDVCLYFRSSAGGMLSGR